MNALDCVTASSARSYISIGVIWSRIVGYRQGKETVDKHLQVLADAGVVCDVRLGRERLWQLEPGQIEEAKRTLEVIGKEWDVALAKLKAFAESA